MVRNAKSTTTSRAAAAKQPAQPSLASPATACDSDSEATEVPESDFDTEDAKDPDYVPGDEKKPRSSAADKESSDLHARALKACNLLAKALKGKRTKLDDSAFDAFKEIAKFVHAQEIEKAIGFASVKMENLRKLGVTKRLIEFNQGILLAESENRKLSDRFELTQEYLAKAGLSDKERLAEIIGVDYFLEAMFNAGDQYAAQREKRAPKIIPQLTAEETQHIHGETRMTFKGYIDFVTFLVQATSKLCDHDVRTVEQVIQHPRIPPSTIVTVEVKRPEAAFDDPHVAEAVAQAMSVGKHSGVRWQRFIMTDARQWKFCLYDNVTKIYYESETLAEAVEGKRAILTVLDDWLWNPEDSELPATVGMWELS